jgi:hypothetical protein
LSAARWVQGSAAKTLWELVRLMPALDRDDRAKIKSAD